MELSLSSNPHSYLWMVGLIHYSKSQHANQSSTETPVSDIGCNCSVMWLYCNIPVVFHGNGGFTVDFPFQKANASNPTNVSPTDLFVQSTLKWLSCFPLWNSLGTLQFYVHISSNNSTYSQTQWWSILRTHLWPAGNKQNIELPHFVKSISECNNFPCMPEVCQQFSNNVNGV